MEFDLYFLDDICGKVYCYEQDLYMIFDITSKIISLDICKVYLKTKKEEISLGILMPKNNMYVLSKKIPKAYFKKFEIDKNSKIYVKCDSKDGVLPRNNGIIKGTIKDKYLKSAICDRVIKESLDDYDIYLFKYNPSERFLFEFCYLLCDFEVRNGEKFVSIKTSKIGEIIV